MAYLAFEAIGLPRTEAELSVSYFGYNLLYLDFKTHISTVCGEKIRRIHFTSRQRNLSRCPRRKVRQASIVMALLAMGMLHLLDGANLLRLRRLESCNTLHSVGSDLHDYRRGSPYAHSYDFCGIGLLFEAMKGIMTTRTAATITGALAGIMSLFSSGLGVLAYAGLYGITINIGA